MLDYAGVNLITDFSSVPGGLCVATLGRGFSRLGGPSGGRKFDYFQRETLYYTRKEKRYWRARWPAFHKGAERSNTSREIAKNRDAERDSAP